MNKMILGVIVLGRKSREGIIQDTSETTIIL